MKHEKNYYLNFMTMKATIIDTHGRNVTFIGKYEDQYIYEIVDSSVYVLTSDDDSLVIIYLNGTVTYDFAPHLFMTSIPKKLGPFYLFFRLVCFFKLDNFTTEFKLVAYNTIELQHFYRISKNS